MKHLFSLLLIFSFSICFGQDENATFEKSKGLLNVPVSSYTRVIQPGCPLHITDCIPRLDLQIFTGAAVDVKSAFDSKVALAFKEEDTGLYIIITQYGDYYTTYFDVSDCSLKKGDYLKQGQFLGCTTKNDDGEYCLSLMLSKNKKNFNPYPWIKW